MITVPNAVNYLDRDEIAAQAAPDERAWLGRRDHTLLARIGKGRVPAAVLQTLVERDTVRGYAKRSP